MPDFKRTPTVNNTTVSLVGHTHTELDTPLGLPGLTGWYAADRIPGVADGAAVATWSDTSGGGRHLTQGTGTKQPTLRYSVLNGLPVVRFDGTSDSMASGATAFTATATKTIIAVGRQTGSGSGTPRLWGLADPTAALNNEGTSNWYYYSNQAAGAVLLGGNTSNWTVVTMAFASVSSVAAYLNGALAASFDPSNGFSTSQALCLGDSFTGAGDYWAGDIAEVVVGTFTVGERQQLESYLGAKWGIAITPRRFTLPEFASLVKWGTD